MADDNIIDTGQVDSDQKDGQPDGGEVDVAKQSDADFMAETVADIKATQAVINGEADLDADGSDDTDDDDDVLSELAGSDIPDAFSDAAEAAGMSASEIIAFADGHTDAELLELIPYLQESDEDVTIQDDKKTDDVDNKDKKSDESSEAEKQMFERISKQLEEKFGASLKEIEDFKAYQAEQSNKQAVDTASKIFDKASETFPIFGKTEELPRFPSGRLAGQLIPTSPEMKARLEVLKYADAFMATGEDIDNAMAQALATYSGLHLEKELERKQVRDLKNHEKNLSGARVGKETKKKYVDSREEMIDEIKQIQRQAGII